MFFWSNVLDNVFEAVESVGRGIDKVVTTGIDGGIAAENFVRENPVKSVAIVAATVATGGLGLAAAPMIAAAIGSTGALGAASTGVAINTLSGAALTNASLAAIGGGAVAAGGGGIAAGTTVVACSTAAVGGAAATATAVATS